jgi:hypothetical protein
MGFVYRNFKYFLYLLIALGLVLSCFSVIANHYKARVKSVARPELGYIITEGKYTLRKKEKESVYSLLDHGSFLYSGDSLLTFNEVATVEIAKIYKSFVILPNSEVTLKQNEELTEFYIEKGNLNLSYGFDRKEKTLKKFKIFKKNEKGEFESYEPSYKLNAKDGEFVITQIGQYFRDRKPQLLISWERGNKKNDLWVELWLGHTENSLELYKVYPFEIGFLNEEILSEQFYWQLRLRLNNEIVSSTPASFWKNEYFAHIRGIYPNQNEVINDQLTFSGIVLKWTKSEEFVGAIVKVYSDDNLTQIVEERKIDNENEYTFKPASHGRYFWKIFSQDHKTASEVNSFYFAPPVEPETKVISWNEDCHDKQYYYNDSVLKLEWTNNSNMPVNKYKVSLTYFSKSNPKADPEIKQENIFTEVPHLALLLKTQSPVKTSIQAFNGKMERLGEPIEKMVSLTRKNIKNGLSFKTHEKTKKKDIISDREAKVNPDESSIVNDFEYRYQILSKDKNIMRNGMIKKGTSVSLKEFPVGYYNLSVHLKQALPDGYVKSQYWKDSPNRSIANVNEIVSEFSIKLVPPVDYNIEATYKNQMPVVNDVNIKE